MSDRHMEKARELRQRVLWESNSSIQTIATALAEAEREGMRRAAEICRRIDDQCGMEAGLAAACAESILSEAGIAVTD